MKQLLTRSLDQKRFKWPVSAVSLPLFRSSVSYLPSSIFGLLVLAASMVAVLAFSGSAQAISQPPGGDALVTARVELKASGGELGSSPSGRAARVLQGRLTSSQLKVLRSPSLTTQKGSEIAKRNELRREEALSQFDVRTRASSGALKAVAEAVQRVGGGVVALNRAGGVLTVQLPDKQVQTIAGRKDVQRLTVVAPERRHALETATQAVGANAFWSVGFMGGKGSKDTNPVDLAIVSDKIQEDHPAFAGVAFQRPAGAPTDANCGKIPDCGHGTQVAAMAISRGVGGQNRGVATGLDTVLDADPDRQQYDATFWALGWGQLSLLDGPYLSGAKDPAEVFSVSYGDFLPGEDDNSELQGIDALHSQLGLSGAYSAGNDGDGEQSEPTVSTPCIAYDTICVGSYDMVTNGPDNTTPGDDYISSFSSRGPTPQGRKKPDLVAVGKSDTAKYNWSNPNNYWATAAYGTSLSAPQVAGGAALLAGSGITDPLAQKAILINSARLGRKTKNENMGTQTGWQPDWGWGALDLKAALAQRTNFHTSGVGSNDVKFYSAQVEKGDRATLVWNRRVDQSFHGVPLTDLNLTQVGLNGGALQADSNSTIDNVEQVMSPDSGQVIYKVKANGSVLDADSEPYALAAKKQITPLTAPRPKVELAVSNSSPKLGETVTVTARITNSSPDLAADSVTVDLNLPGTLGLVSGSATQTLPALGQGGEATPLSWQVKVTGSGPHRIGLKATASVYGEQFATAAETQLNGSSTSTVVENKSLVLSPAVKIKSLKRMGDRTLKVTGTFNSKASIKKLAISLKIGKRTVKLKQKAVKKGKTKGSWSATYKLPSTVKIAKLQRVKVTARYSKAGTFKAQTVAKTFSIKVRKSAKSQS